MNMNIILIVIMFYFYFCDSKVKNVSKLEKTSKYWLNEGASQIHKRLHIKDNTEIAKNIILFIGDGMGLSTVSAARIYKNQKMINETAPDIGLFFESFPNTALIKTHSTDAYVADSSSTATAIVTGIKTNSGVVGVSPEVVFNDCTSHNKNEQDLETIATMFKKQGKSVGIVTTTRITHATPSVMYAHSASRNWESNVPRGCLKKDIASQLIDKSNIFNVLLGGGRSYFLPKNENGKREDNKDLINEWKFKMKNLKSKYITNLTEFRNINFEDTDYLLGLFSEDHLDYDEYRVDQPSLEDMTQAALKILSKNKKGFFLMVEGGRIDHAHHKSKAKLALSETLALEKAVKMGYMMANITETLIIVTADHSHVFTMGSYVKRENDITKKNEALAGKELDGNGHTSLLYSNGPVNIKSTKNITESTNFTSEFVYRSGVPLISETHAGEEVAIYSEGPWAHLFNGVYHQSYIGHVMMFASCNGPYRDNTIPHCSSFKL